MTVDEFELRDLAKELAGLYRELGEARFARAKPPEVRVMRPSPGPRPPVPDHLVSLDEELSSRLFEFVRDCCNHIQPTKILTRHGQRLASWIAWHAYDVAQLDVASDLLEEMQDQARRIGKLVHPPEPKQVAKRLEPYHRAEVIIQRAARQGHKLTRDGLRKLTERSQATEYPISTEQYGGRTTYRFTEVMAYINRKDSNQ